MAASLPLLYRNAERARKPFESDPLLAPLHGDAAFRALLDELRRGRARYESLYAELQLPCGVPGIA